ncbi:MAG: sulfatase [Bacteroidales bacterium]|nr:sulfatase [Candidatus Cryptobacteroides aphodequi]
MKPVTRIVVRVAGANLALLNAFNAYCAEKSDPAKPNVVFILIDDMGWCDLGCYGSEFYETPNIDALAGQGVRFTDAYASCHVSSPARASLLTGLYPASNGVTDWLPGRREYPFQKSSTTRVEQDLPHNIPNIAGTMKDNGYATAIIGKWHLGETGAVPQEYGFDIHIPNGYLRGWPDTYYYPFGMNGYDGQPGDYLTDKMTDEAIDYIASHKDEPFFLLLSHFATHDPIQGRPDLVEKYTRKLASWQRPDRPGYILEGNPDDPDALSREECLALLSQDEYKANRILPHNLVKIKQIQDNVNFAAMVGAVDESVGRVVSALDSLGLSENTIVIFFADNGGMSAANYGNPNKFTPIGKEDLAYASSMLPLRGGKGWMYEGGLRVPLIIKWPGQGSEGVECRTPVTTPDLYSTIVSMTGSKAPADAGSDGVDISPLLKGGKIRNRAIYWHFPHYSNHGMVSPCGAIRRGNYKLIEYYDNGTVQLFDVKNDIGETCDIAAEHPLKVARLRRELASWRKKVGAKMPTPNASYNPDLAKVWYEDAAPFKFWPSQVADTQYGVQGSEMEWAVPAQGDSGMDAKLLAILDSLKTYRKHGAEQSLTYCMDNWKSLNSAKRSIEGERTECLWNILCSELFDLTGQGRFIGAVIPQNGGSFYDVWRTIAYNHIAGELNNNLEVTALAEGRLEPGIKFGGGLITVTKPAEGTTVVKLVDYAQPYTYKTYSIDVYVGTGNKTAKAKLNGKAIEAKVNNRGFVSVRRAWMQGDELIVTK